MKHLAKRVTFLLCIFLIQPALPMHKINIFNNIKKDTTLHNNIFTIKSFNKFPKKFSALRAHTNQHLKKYLGIGLGAGLFGYGLYSSQQSIGLVKRVENAPRDDHSKKQVLIEEYALHYKSMLTPENFKQANDNEKEIMTHAIIKCIKQNNENLDVKAREIILDFSILTLFLNDEQKKTFYTLYVQLLKNGYLDTDLTLLLYSGASHNERKILLEGICATIEQLEKIEWEYIDQIYNNYSNPEEKKILDKAIAKRIGIDKLNLEDTQSGSLFKHNIGDFYMSIFNMFENKHWCDIESLKKIITQCLESEISYAKKEYDILYHGMTRKGAWNQWLYTELHRKKYKKNLDNYIFTRFMQDTTCQENGGKIFLGKIVHESLLEKGGFEDYKDNSFPREDGNELMFTNHGISTYPKWPGKNSLWYCAANFNQKPSTITNQEIFALFGQEEFYLKNKKYIDTLEQQFITFAEGGVLLQVAFPKKSIEKYIYSADHAGRKQTIWLKNGEKQKATITELFNALKQNPETIIDRDKMEFVMIVTPDVVQKLGYKNVEIKMYDTANQEKTNKIFNDLRHVIAPLWASNEYFETPYECYKKHYKN